MYIGYILLLALFVLLFRSLPTGFHPDHGTFAEAYDAAFENRDADLLLLGSSRMAASLDDGSISKALHLKCYNMAFNQANLSYVYDLLRAYLSHSKKVPQYVVLDVSWFSFDNRRLSYKEYAAQFVLQNPALFYEELLLNKKNQLGNASLTLIRSLERSGDAYVDFDTRRNRWTDQDSTKVNYIFDSKDEGFLRTFPQGRAKMVPAEMRAFEQIITLLKERGITLVLYTSPEDRTFSESQKNREEVYNYIDHASEGSVWMDYTLRGNLYKPEYEKWLNDSHHIYFKKKFTQRFLTHFKEKFP
jgi:hypothetical protein